jgi:hypothetical protein
MKKCESHLDGELDVFCPHCTGARFSPVAFMAVLAFSLWLVYYLPTNAEQGVSLLLCVLATMMIASFLRSRPTMFVLALTLVVPVLGFYSLEVEGVPHFHNATHLSQVLVAVLLAPLSYALYRGWVHANEYFSEGKGGSIVLLAATLVLLLVRIAYWATSSVLANRLAAASATSSSAVESDRSGFTPDFATAVSAPAVLAPPVSPLAPQIAPWFARPELAAGTPPLEKLHHVLAAIVELQWAIGATALAGAVVITVAIEFRRQRRLPEAAHPQEIVRSTFEELGSEGKYAARVWAAVLRGLGDLFRATLMRSALLAGGLLRFAISFASTVALAFTIRALASIIDEAWASRHFFELSRAQYAEGLGLAALYFTAVYWIAMLMRTQLIWRKGSSTIRSLSTLVFGGREPREFRSLARGIGRYSTLVATSLWIFWLGVLVVRLTPWDTRSDQGFLFYLSTGVAVTVGALTIFTERFRVPFGAGSRNPTE